MMRSLAAQLGWRATSYKGMGFLTELTVDSATLKQLVSGTRTLHIRFAVPVDAAVRGGVSIYGETVGCWPVGPTVILSTQ